MNTFGKPNPNKPLILVVEDDVTIASSIAQRLNFEGWEVKVVGSGSLAVLCVAEFQFDCVVLDLMLPEMDGFGVIQEIRKNSNVPIIVLTAMSDESTELDVLAMGADDFLTKPLRPSILASHIKVWLSPYENIKNNQHETTQGVLEVGDFSIDRDNYTVTLSGEIIHLTPIEFAILFQFALRPGKTFSRDFLLKKIWNWDDSNGTRTVDSHIKSLRKKIGSDYVKTVHGVGYCFHPSDAQ